eukprot:TRINITY_DN39835_c0_g1_i1.p1 TRINITY_DN39835_c0_g1~~TRINITY_DN39835_c0_g1_i1.p1  ORF type:complete len:255 (+),score=40.58 TRINITY_DN39835_c0_g1_i1:35-799(+)
MTAKRDRNEIPSMVSGSFGGFCGAIFSFPLDTLKVRVQAGKTTNIFKNIFSGVTTPVMMCTPQWACIYWGYKTGVSWAPEDAQWKSALGGLVAGLSCSVVYTPMQCIKCTAQVNKCSTLEAAQLVYRFGGIRRGLYRGYVPTLMYELPGYSAFFYFYDEAKELLPGNGSLSNHLQAAIAASLAESFLGMPGDTLRTRYQTDRSLTSTRAAAKEIYELYGVRGFYRGFLLRVAFGGTINGVSLGAIELLHRWWES